MKLKLPVIFISIFLFFSPTQALISQSEYENYIKQQMKKQNIQAFAVLLFIEDQILYQGNFGFSNVETQTPLNQDDVFLMASVSKMVTATALLQLIDQGKFSLDDNINDFLPFTVSIPHQETKITFRMLLTHTSAIADGAALDNQYFYGKDSPIKLKYFLENYFTPNGKLYNAQDNFHSHKPGAKFNYSNVGSALIGYLVEYNSGMDFAKYTQKYIFKPLGMANSHWRLANIKNNIVTLYEDGEPVENYTFTDYPNGGLYSTALDMHKFIYTIANYGRFDGPRIVSHKLMTEMFKSQIPDIDETVGLQIYYNNQESRMWGHEGGEQGITTYVGSNLSNNKAGVILFATNSDVELQEIIEISHETAIDALNYWPLDQISKD